MKRQYKWTLNKVNPRPWKTLDLGYLEVKIGKKTTLHFHYNMQVYKSANLKMYTHGISQLM